MRRPFLLSIMVLGAVILTGSVAVRAQQDPYEPASATSTAAEPATDTGQPAASDQATTADTTTPGEPAKTEADDQMPRTASPLPLIALIGIMSIGASLRLRSMSRVANGEADASDR